MLGGQRLTPAAPRRDSEHAAPGPVADRGGRRRDRPGARDAARRRRGAGVEAALRPRSLAEFVGQPKVREQLALVLESALRRGRPPDHVLLSGAPGLGKTSLALIIAAELGTAVRITSGPAIERAGDLAAMLTSLAHGDVLFIDEIHRIARPAEELLYIAMEDFRVDVVVGKGPGATAIPLEVAPFTLVGATTRAGLLTGPLRDRFGFVGHMDFYEPAELRAGARPLRRAARRQLTATGPPRSPAGPAARRGSPTGCCAGSATTPRCGPTAWSTGRSRGPRSPCTTSTSSGSTGSTGRCSTRWSPVRRRPVGLATLAVAVGEEPRHGRGGLRAVPGAGRAAGPHAPRPGGHRAAWRHLGRPLPRGGALLGGAGGAISGLPGAPSTRGRLEPLFAIDSERGAEPGVAVRVPSGRRALCTDRGIDVPERPAPGRTTAEQRARREAHRRGEVLPDRLIAFAVVLFVLPQRQRKRMQRKAQATPGLCQGTPVMTTAGLHGNVAASATHGRPRDRPRGHGALRQGRRSSRCAGRSADEPTASTTAPDTGTPGARPAAAGPSAGRRPWPTVRCPSALLRRFLLILAVLYAWCSSPGHASTPELGLDSRRHQVTLTARTPDSKPPPSRTSTRPADHRAPGQRPRRRRGRGGHPGQLERSSSRSPARTVTRPGSSADRQLRSAGDLRGPAATPPSGAATPTASTSGSAAPSASASPSAAAPRPPAPTAGAPAAPPAATARPTAPADAGPPATPRRRRPEAVAQARPTSTAHLRATPPGSLDRPTDVIASATRTAAQVPARRPR